MNGTGSNEIFEGRGYWVSILTSEETVDGEGRVFISGSVRNKLVYHSKAKKKFVYYETLFFKDSWGNMNVSK